MHWNHVHCDPICAYDLSAMGSLEDPMVVLKGFVLAALAFSTLFAMMLMLRRMQTVKARVQTRPVRTPALRRLRQDPRTGVYYPVED